MATPDVPPDLLPIRVAVRFDAEHMKTMVQRATWRTGRIQKVLLLVGSLGPLAIALVVGFARQGVLEPSTTYFLWGLITQVIAFGSTLVLLASFNRVDPPPFIGEPAEYLIDELGVVSTGPRLQSRYSWFAFTEAERCSDGILLRVGTNTVMWLPDAGVQSPANPDRLWRLVATRQLGPPARIHPPLARS